MRLNAASRLACCDLRSVAVTVMPVGRCTRRTPVWTLLRCCPPGPLAIMNSRSQSRSSDSRSVGYMSANKLSLLKYPHASFHAKRPLSHPKPRAIFALPLENQHRRKPHSRLLPKRKSTYLRLRHVTLLSTLRLLLRNNLTQQYSSVCMERTYRE